MSQFYYTISSLPFLSYGEAPPITSDEFFRRCEVELDESQFSVLTNLRDDNHDVSGAPSLVGTWYEWDDSLRNELVRLRAKDLSLDESPFLMETDSVHSAEETARTAFKKGSPLEAEILIDRDRWTFLDWQKSGHIFDFQALIIYYLQLRILERQSSFNVDAGFARYKDIYSNVMDNVNEQKVE